MHARVLVIDDNRSNLDLMLYLLRAFGYEADGVSDARTGIESAASAAYDVVLVDILMPGMDGHEFARHFKANPAHAGVPLVAVTALAMVGDRERILASGFEGYISKPIDPQRFVSQVEAFVATDRRTSRAVRAASESTASAPLVAAGPIVMAVDDVPENLAFVRAALEPFGYRVIEATSVDEALLMLKRTRPSVVLCDLHMPRRDGFELISFIRAEESLKEIPFLFLSSTSWQTADRRRGLEMGARKFLLRPIPPEALRKEIEVAMEGA